MALPTEERNKRVLDLKTYWLPLLESLNTDGKPIYFYPKPVIRKEGEDPYILWFPNELKKMEDLYTEVVDFNVVPTNTSRRLFKFKANPFYEKEYEVVQTPIGEQYKIPFSEFVEVSKPQEQITTGLKTPSPEEVLNSIPEHHEEQNVNTLTARDWACIHLVVPKSNKAWLNDLIKEKLKRQNF